MDIQITPAGHRLGYRPSPVDHSLRARLAPILAVTLPPSVSFLANFPGISNQGAEGACTGFSEAEFCAVWHSLHGNQSVPKRSAAYIYAKARQAEGTFPKDAGSNLADGFGCLEAFGCCSEQLLPFSGDPAEAPTDACDADAKPWVIPAPSMVPHDELSFKRVLARGSPISITIPVYSAFEQTSSLGNVALPDISAQLLGYHALLCIGYDDSGWLVANSWGPSWGQDGFCHFAYGWEAHFIESYCALP